MNSESLISKLHDVAVVYDGERFVEAKMLYDSRLCPKLFGGFRSQPRKAVQTTLVVGEHYMIARRVRGSNPAEYKPLNVGKTSTSTSACYLVRLAYLLERCELQEPKAQGRQSKALKALIVKHGWNKAAADASRPLQAAETEDAGLTA
jgi:hypothetical protein